MDAKTLETMGKLGTSLGNAGGQIGGNIGQGASLGSSIGSAFGPIGTAVGLGVGAVGGLAYDYFTREDPNEALQLAKSNEINAQAAALSEKPKPTFQYGGGEMISFNGNADKIDGIELANKVVSHGEVQVGNYIFSNHLKPKGSKQTFAELAKKIDARYKGRDNIFTAESRKREFENLQKQHEMAREGLPENDKGHFKNGGYKEHFYDGGEEDPYAKNVTVKDLYNPAVAEISPNEQGFETLTNKSPEQILMRLATEKYTPRDNRLPNPYAFKSNLDVVSKLGTSTITGLSNDKGSLMDRVVGYKPNLETNFDVRQGYTGVNSEAASRDNGSGDTSGINWNKLGEAGAVMLPNILGSAANAYLASKINYDRVSPTYQDTNLIDPNRALQQVGSTYSGANAALQSNTQGGQYLTNRLASAASEASKRAEIAQQYANANAGILNTASAANAQSQMQANMTNAQIQQQELGDRLSGYASSVQSLQQGASDYLKAWQEQRRTEQLMPFLGGPNFKAYLDAGYNPASLMEATLYDKTYRNKNEFKR